MIMSDWWPVGFANASKCVWRLWKEIEPTWVNCASLDRTRKVMWQKELHQDLGAPSCCAGQTLHYCGGFKCRTLYELYNTKRSRHYTIDSQRFLLCALHCAGSGSQILLSLASLGADIYHDADTYSLIQRRRRFLVQGYSAKWLLAEKLQFACFYSRNVDLSLCPLFSRPSKWPQYWGGASKCRKDCSDGMWPLHYCTMIK